MLKNKEEKEKMNFMPDFDEIDNQADLKEDDIVFAVDSRGNKSVSSEGSQVNLPLKKPRQKGPIDSYFTPDPEIVVQNRKAGKGKQTTINDAYNKKVRERAVRCVARWMYDVGIAFNAINYDSFLAVIESIGQYGLGMKLPTYHEVRITYLKKEVELTRNLMKDFIVEWAKIGCTIMADGWKDRKERALINFLVNSPEGTMFLESVDASSYSKIGEKMFELLDKYVQRIGSEYVVQVVTDSTSNNVVIGKFLEAKYPHLYWSFCAAHCIDLMLEDIFKIPLLHGTLRKGIALTGFIYNHGGVLNMMRGFTNQRELLRPAKIRFATTFLTLARVHKQKSNLRKMFILDEWTTSKWLKEQTSKELAKVVISPSFWNNIVYALKLVGPLVRILRLVDSEIKSSMGYIYEAMNRAKEAIAKTFNNMEDKYKMVFTIIDQRWEVQLHRPLHAAGHFRNLEFFYSNPNIKQDAEVMKGLYQCIEKMNTDTN